MKTIFLAGEIEHELQPLTGGLPVGTLQFLVKPLSVFPIEMLRQAGCEDFIIYSPNPINAEVMADKIRPYLEWGVKLKTSQNIGNLLDEETLWLRDDVLYDIEFSQMLISACPKIK